MQEELSKEFNCHEFQEGTQVVFLSCLKVTTTGWGDGHYEASKNQKNMLMFKSLNVVVVNFEV